MYNYYGVKGDEVWHHKSDAGPRNLRWFVPKLFEESDKVWCQGPQGGVRLVHYNWALYSDVFRKYGYITRDREAMKEFAWIKLKAKQLN